MASLRYLWNHRAKFNLGSLAFYRAWAKRALSFPEVYKRNARRNHLVKNGARIHELAEIGEANIQGKKNLLTIGRYTTIGKALIALHDEVMIGERVVINDDAEILTASHDVLDTKMEFIKKKIVIEDYVWIGTGAMILPGVTLGKGSVVGARAVVGKSIAPGVIVIGNPARPTSKTRNENLDYNPCEFLAGNKAWLQG